MVERSSRVPARRPRTGAAAARSRPGLRQHGDPRLGGRRHRDTGRAGDWLRSRGLAPGRRAGRPGARSCAHARCATCSASLASRNTRGGQPDEGAAVGVRGDRGRAPLRFELDERGGLRLAPAGDGVDGALAEILVACARGAGLRGLAATQVVSRPALRLALLRRVAGTPRRGGARCRSAGTGRRPPRTAGAGGRDVRSAAFVAALAWKRLRRRDSGALVTAARARGRDGRARRRARGRHDRDRPRDGAGDRADPDVRALGAGGVVRHPRRPERASSQRSTRASTTRSPGSGSTGRRRSSSSARAPSPGGSSASRRSTASREHVILRSGRLPRTCTPGALRGAAACAARGALPSAPGLRLVEVGHGTLRSRQLYGDFLRPTDAATADASLAPALRRAGRVPPAPAGAARRRRRGGPRSRAPRSSRARIARTPGSGRSRPGNPRLWEHRRPRRADGARARRARASARSSFAVDAPVEELRAAERAADVAGTRLLLVGGEGAALLLAFTILAARGMRRDLEAARRRLTWFGAQRWQLWLLGGVESAAVAVAGVVLGWLAGIARRRARRACSPERRSSTCSARASSPRAGSAARDGAWPSLPRSSSGSRCRCRRAHGARASARSTSSPSRRSRRCRSRARRRRRGRGAARSRRRGRAVLLLLVPGLIASPRRSRSRGSSRSLARWWSGRGRQSLSSRLAAVGLGTRARRSCRDGRVPDDRLRGRAPRRGVSGDARARRSRAGGVRRCRTTSSSARTCGNLVRVFDAAPIERFEQVVGEDGAARPVLRVSGRRRTRRARERRHRCSGSTRRRSRTSASGEASGRRVGARPSSRALVEPGALGRDARRSCSRTTGSSSGSARRSSRSPRSCATPDGVVPAARARRGRRATRPRVLRARGAARFDARRASRSSHRRASSSEAPTPASRSSRTSGSPGRSRRSFASWVGVGGVGRPSTPRTASAVRVPLTLQRSSGLRATQPTDASPPDGARDSTARGAGGRRRRDASAADRRRLRPGAGRRQSSSGSPGTERRVGGRRSHRAADCDQRGGARGCTRERGLARRPAERRARRRRGA